MLLAEMTVDAAIRGTLIVDRCSFAATVAAAANRYIDRAINRLRVIQSEQTFTYPLSSRNNCSFAQEYERNYWVMHLVEFSNCIFSALAIIFHEF